MPLPPIYRYPTSSEPDLSPLPRYTAIYGLFDPRDRLLHYIGQTTNLEKRREEHLSDANYGVARSSSAWIRSVLFATTEPALKVIAWVPSTEATQVEDNHIATALHYELPLTNDERLDKGDLLLWSSLTHECAKRPQINTVSLASSHVGAGGGKASKTFNAQEIAGYLWEYMLSVHADSGRNTVSWRVFIDTDFVEMTETVHQEMAHLVPQMLHGTGPDGRLRYNVSALIRKYQGRSGKRG